MAFHFPVNISNPAIDTAYTALLPPVDLDAIKLQLCNLLNLPPLPSEANDKTFRPPQTSLQPATSSECAVM